MILSTVIVDHFHFCNIATRISRDVDLLFLQEFKDSPNFSDKLTRMSTKRCVDLITVSIANKLDEVWIAENPALLMTYTNQYFPNLFRWYVLLSFMLIQPSTTEAAEMDRL